MSDNSCYVPLNTIVSNARIVEPDEGRSSGRADSKEEKKTISNPQYVSPTTRMIDPTFRYLICN
jgi:hypothetical protein